MKNKNGFTIVELIVVIAIIGVLAGILVPAMTGYVKDSKQTSADANAKTIYNAVNNFAQSCVNDGVYLCQENGFLTDVLYINESSGSASVKNVGETPDKGISPNAVAELEKAVNSVLGNVAKGSAYRVVFNSAGFPAKIYWAKTDEDKIVGTFPIDDPVGDVTIGDIA